MSPLEFELNVCLPYLPAEVLFLLISDTVMIRSRCSIANQTLVVHFLLTMVHFASDSCPFASEKRRVLPPRPRQ